MLVYKQSYRVLKEKDKIKFNLTTVIASEIKEDVDIEQINWYLCYNNKFSIIITFNDNVINKSEYNVIYEKKVESHIHSSNILYFPPIISNILNLNHKDPIMIEEHKVNEKFLICVRFLRDLQNEYDLRSIYENPVINDIESKLRFFNRAEFSIPRFIREEIPINEGDFLVLTLYDDEYVEIKRFDDLIKYEIENDDEMIFRTVKQMYSMSTLYCIDIPKVIVEDLDLENYEYVHWNIYLNKKHPYLRIKFS